MSHKTPRRSNFFSHIKTVDQFLQKRDLFEKFRRMLLGFETIQPGHYYETVTEEKNDDLIQLLIDLKIVDYDWDELEKQTHRAIGDRLIEFGFSGDKITQLYNRITGKNGIIKREAIELISNDIESRFTLDKIIQLFVDLGVPQSMFSLDTAYHSVFYILSYYATSESEKDHLTFIGIIQEFLHPLMFAGDEEKTKETREKYRKWLKHNERLSISEDGQLYLGPTREEYELGIDNWVDVNGKTVDPETYLLFPNHIARLWVLWSQLVVVVNAYENGQSLDRKELEKLYLDIIEKAEEIIKYGKLGRLKKIYLRPFTSLATAHIECNAKKAGSPLDLVGAFLLEIAALKPGPAQVNKEMEESSELIARTTNASKAISGEQINLLKLSYEQALFLLKLIVEHIFRILDVVSTGYTSFADERLNAKYILFLDNLRALLTRKDFEKIKEGLPQNLPEHLISVEDLDIWWEHGGKAEVMNFIGNIEVAWVRAGQQTFPLTGWLIQHFNATDEVMAEHRKYKASKWNRIIQNVDKQKSQGDSLPESPKREEQRGGKKILDALDDAIIRSLKNLSLTPQNQSSQQTVQKIEITAMPEIHIKGENDEVKIRKNKTPKIKTQIFLTRNGDLYKEPKRQFCYPMEENSDRHRLVKILSERNDYILTSELALRLNAQGRKTEATIRKEIGEINNKVLALLKLKNFIEGKKSSGYRLNYKIKILDR